MDGYRLKGEGYRLKGDGYRWKGDGYRLKGDGHTIMRYIDSLPILKGNQDNALNYSLSINIISYPIKQLRLGLKGRGFIGDLEIERIH